MPTMLGGKPQSRSRNPADHELCLPPPWRRRRWRWPAIVLVDHVMWGSGHAGHCQCCYSQDQQCQWWRCIRGETKWKTGTKSPANAVSPHDLHRTTTTGKAHELEWVRGKIIGGLRWGAMPWSMVNGKLKKHHGWYGFANRPAISDWVWCGDTNKALFLLVD